MNTRKNKKYHIIYETVCTVNNKKYLGMHSSNSLMDDYLGSGLLLTRAIKKYGKESFKRTNLFIFDTFDDMVIKEKELINETITSSPEYYNMMKGGYGGAQKGEVAKKISKSIKAMWDNMTDDQKSSRMKKVINSLTPEQRTRRVSGKNNGMYGKKHTLATRKKLCENSKRRDRRIHIFKHKDGMIFEGEISIFYKKFDLCRAWVSRVISGEKKSIKGWVYKGIKNEK